MAAIMNYGPRYGLNFMHPDKIATLPCITFGAGDGLFPKNVQTFGEFVLLEGFDHMDPMFASANTPTHRKNEVIYPLLDFVAKNRR
jgi:hypothetical protein